MSTATVFKWVIDDVVSKMRSEVVQEGVDESVLDELRSLWEQKLNEKGLLSDAAPSAPALHRPMPAAGTNILGGISIPAGVNPLALQAQLAILAARGAPGAAAALAGLKRAQPEGGFGLPNVVPAPAAPRVPQQDGAGDDGEDEEEGGDADDGEKADGAGQEEAADDEVLSSDSEEEDDEEEDVQDFLCCQFEKVARTKNRWKISMREGVFHINGKDYLFKKAQGEWIF